MKLAKCSKRALALVAIAFLLCGTCAADRELRSPIRADTRLRQGFGGQAQVRPYAGSGFAFVSSPSGRRSRPTTKAKAVRATGVPIVRK